MNSKRAKRFEELKQRAIMILHELDMLTGDGSIIHDRNKYHYNITRRTQRLEEKGEEILVGEYGTIWYTIEGLEQKLKEANIWITKVKLRGR